MEPISDVENSKESYSQFFQSLEPNGDGKIHVSTFKELLKKGMGDKYDEEKMSGMIADLALDVDGKISVDELAETFLTGPRNPKLAFALHNLLQYFPELVPTSDLNQFLEIFGIDISPEKAKDVIEMTRVSLMESLGKRFEKQPLPKNKEEVKEERIRLRKKLEKQIVELGGTVPNVEDEDVESD